MGTVDSAMVARVLREISQYLQLKGENAFKTRAYDLASERVLGLEDLAERVQKKTLQQISGIGPALAEKITELVSTGQLAYYETLRAEFPPKMLELLQVPEMGPKKAQALWAALGVDSLERLQAACEQGEVAKLKGFGPKTQEKILAGLALLKRRGAGARHRLDEVLPWADELLGRLKAVPIVQRVSLGGSARRLAETVGDLDLIASAPEHAPVFAALKSHPEVVQVIAEGDSKCSVRMARGDLQVDLRVLPDEDFATALHHFTGSKAHHVRLRGRALDRGLKISEWGVHRGDEKLSVPDEDTLYRLLDLPYIPPELREDWGEIEAADSDSLPDDLVRVEDVVGNVHSHSTWSDGRNTLEEMAKAARDLGLSYLTVTEHSQSAGYAGGLKEDDLKRQWDEIDSVNERVSGITLLKGIESDILEDGRLDYPDRILEKLDVVIGSIHQRHSQDEAQMTARILAAFDNPYLHIWGHPTGRLLHKREPSAMDLDRILDKAARRNIIVEVNGNPERLDLKAEHVKLALKHDVRLVVSTDAHSVRELKNVKYSVAMARKGWARRSQVLNTLDAQAFVATLRTLRA